VKILRIFARSVPDFVLKGRFADLVKLDSQALEQETGFDVDATRRHSIIFARR
jgi:hypothetical protein